MDAGVLGDVDRTARQLQWLEQRYRRTMDTLSSAQYAQAGLQELASKDARLLRHSLSKVQYLHSQAIDLRTAIELLNDGIGA